MFSFSWSIFFTSSTVSVAWTSRETVFPYIAVRTQLPLKAASFQSQEAELTVTVLTKICILLLRTYECHFMQEPHDRLK